jgi:single-stranded-DNA-specific exonuclease
MTPLSLTGKRWVVRETSADGISIPEMLLARRKIGALGQGEIIEGVIGYDAHGFNDFEKAAARIEKAIKDEELIGIFGDYDCDGITATAIMGRFLKRHGNAPIMRLPHRQKEGYGLRKKTMDDFKESGVTLLITVDTGVTALEPITHANELGIDVIVLDHHHLPEILPPAFAILHQGLASPAPDAAPCAAGIAWSAVQAKFPADDGDRRRSHRCRVRSHA